jgi:23S rRNA pseudouridine1911/1915/1917 synthase
VAEPRGESRDGDGQEYVSSVAHGWQYRDFLTTGSLLEVDTFTVSAEKQAARLDHYLAVMLPAYSRARLQEWIEAGRVRVDGAPRKASYKLRAGETVEVEPAEQKPLRAVAEEIPLEILYEDADVVAINKPAGMVVHAGAGRHEGTLVNALLHHFGTLSAVGGELRPGIVHRLDKGTSGVMLAARHDAAHRELANQFSSRTVQKTYLALVQGVVKKDTGRIDLRITRDPVRRTRMTARLETGREAHTEYRVLERFGRHTLLEVRIGTGRTHQIRVHLASMGHPIAGDTLYGGAAQPDLGRPWLHSFRLRFALPSSGTEITLEAPLPHELEAWKSRLL